MQWLEKLKALFLGRSATEDPLDSRPVWELEKELFWNGAQAKSESVFQEMPLQKAAYDGELHVKAIFEKDVAHNPAATILCWSEEEIVVSSERERQRGQIYITNVAVLHDYRFWMCNFIIESIEKSPARRQERNYARSPRVVNTKAIKLYRKWIRLLEIKENYYYNFKNEDARWNAVCITAKNTVFIPFIRVFIYKITSSWFNDGGGHISARKLRASK